jgi:TRAP-type C4-dicarboxylate transport system permease small subunit
MRKWLKRSLIVFVAVAFVVSAFIGMAAFDLWRQNNYKSEIQTLQVPSLNIQFVLLTDIAGFEDRAWYVYQLPVGMKILRVGPR